jgi:EGF-like domain
MKKTLFSALAAFALITSIFYLASCGTEDLCAAVDCGPHGKCNATTGTCDCDAGYEKDTNGRCDLSIRDKFIGEFTQIDKAESVADTAYCTEKYSIKISADASSISKIAIDNLGGSDTKFTATISSTDAKVFTVDPNQKFSFNGVIFDAAGDGAITADGKTLTVKYSFSNNGKRLFGCTAVGTKK